MNNLLMKYYMKVCICVDELLYACLCCNYLDDYMMLRLHDEYLRDCKVDVVKSSMSYVVVD